MKLKNGAPLGSIDFRASVAKGGIEPYAAKNAPLNRTAVIGGTAQADFTASPAPDI